MASGGAGVTDAEGGRLEEYPTEWNLRDSSPLLEVVNLVGVKYKGRGEKSKCTPDRHRSRFARRTQQPSLLSFFFSIRFFFFFHSFLFLPLFPIYLPSQNDLRPLFVIYSPPT